MQLGVPTQLIAYYLVILITFVECLIIAWVVYWRNRRQITGAIWGLASIGLGVWSLGFSQYFRPLPEETALFWARITLSAAIINTSLYFHGMNALIGTNQKYRKPIWMCYALSFVFVWLTWFGPLISGLREWTYLDHYIRYQRWLYPLLSLHIGGWPFAAVCLLIKKLRSLTGYKRNQIIYFLIATGIIFLATTLIVVLIEYEIAVPPVVFFVLPFNMGFLAYVLAKARLMEINLAVGKALVYGTTLFVVLLVSLVVVGIVNQIDPDFLSGPQTMLMILIVMLVSAGLAALLPRVAPQAEQALQARLSGGRYRYQEALAGLTSEIATISDADELLQMVVDKIVEHMKVPQAMVLMQDDLTTDFVPRARASLQGANGEVGVLAENTEVIRWLRRHRRSLVEEEVQFRETVSRAGRIAEELEKIGASLCVPMVLDGQLVGTLAIENKISGDMFVDQDIRLLESLCSEVALAVKYRKFEQQMMQASKLASLGTLAAGIAHEIRNPLSSIKTFVQLLPTRPNDPEFQAEFSKLVSSDVDRISKIVENVLSFARSSSITVTEQRIEDVIEDSLHLVHSKLKNKNIEVTKQYQNLPMVKVDKDQMAQVFVNILLNAIEALPNRGGVIRVTGSTALLESPKDTRRRKTPHVIVEIADNGPGIPENIKGRLFDPFFTTKAQGTGLGLSITHQIVETHGGFITIKSSEGQGATFSINLPL